MREYQSAPAGDEGKTPEDANLIGSEYSDEDRLENDGRLAARGTMLHPPQPGRVNYLGVL